MSVKFTFERYEYKYLLNAKQKEELFELMKQYMKKDPYGRCSIYNLYYDTPNFFIIRNCMEKAPYREKLRLRSYGKVDEEDKVFLELKKKYEKITYKRRLSLSEKTATNYFNNTEDLEKSQISSEIAYFRKMHNDIQPKIFIAYDRRAFFGKDDSSLRITFDENIVWRENELNLRSDKYGENLLPDGMTLMEVKVSKAVPLWLTEFLSKNKIYKTPFSKYGNVYQRLMTKKGGCLNVG